MNTSRSQAELDKWTRIYAKVPRKTANERLSRYLGSQMLGREFGETVEAYFERKRLTEFAAWAYEQVGA
jgi:hypothetical protein